MKKISIFKNFNDLVKNMALSEVLQQIKSEPKLKIRIETLRKHLADGNKTAYDQAKKSLIAFTPSGTFANGRKADLLETYTQYIILDIDKLDIETLQNIKKTTQEIPYTLTCFTSPSGAGIKIIVEVDSESADHCNAYNQVKTFYEAQLQQTIDRSGKDVSRLCFYSYDPDIFINENHLIFEIDKGIQELFEDKKTPVLPLRLQVLPSGEDLGEASLFLHAMLLTQKKMHFTEGNRNNFVYLFASNCNRLGISETETQAYSNTEFLELAPSEIRQTITSAYKHHQNEFGKYQKQNNQSSNKKHQNNAYLQHNKPPLGGLEANLAIGEEAGASTIDQLLLSTPFLPEEIFPLLPDLLREGCEAFTLRRDKDVFLTGALAILSGCIQNVKGNYGGADTYTNLFAFIVAPAASGKGALLHARTLGKAYHKTLTEQSISAKRNYDADFAAYKEELSKAIKNGTTTPEEPTEPPFKMLYIPGNSSAAMVMKHLQDSAGFGIMCETEADTIGQVLKQDWGGFSDILRKAFHFEPISISRKGNKEYIDIEQPRLSVAISGTPDQVTKLIPTAENGLFSRFLFYAFSTEVEWLRNARKFQPFNKTEHFNQLSLHVSEMIEFLETYPTNFDFTDEQWDVFDEYFNDTIRQKYCFLGSEVLSCIKRAALIQFRLAMILTALRKFEDCKNHGLLPSTDKEFHYCNAQDFDISHQLINTYIEHAIFILEKLPKSESGLLLNKSNPKYAFFKSLPQEFEFGTATEHGETFKISPRTVRNYINSLLENNLLAKTQYGHYTKTLEKVKNV